jgi:hypothetical protein
MMMMLAETVTPWGFYLSKRLTCRSNLNALVLVQDDCTDGLDTDVTSVSSIK